MVTYKLVKRTDESLVYWYYPENDEEKQPGIIDINIIEKEIEIVQIAEDDWMYEIPVTDLNNMAKTINHFSMKSGEIIPIEEANEPIYCFDYGFHAVHNLEQRLSKGEVPENGVVMWY